eukprot:4465260-Amphidinium_carterae.1
MCILQGEPDHHGPCGRSTILGPEIEIQNFLKTLEAELQLKHVTKVQKVTPLIFLGRHVESYSDHIVMSMTKKYYDTLLKLFNLQEYKNP